MLSACGLQHSASAILRADIRLFQPMPGATFAFEVKDLNLPSRLEVERSTKELATLQRRARLAAPTLLAQEYNTPQYFSSCGLLRCFNDYFGFRLRYLPFHHFDCFRAFSCGSHPETTLCAFYLAGLRKLLFFAGMRNFNLQRRPQSSSHFCFQLRPQFRQTETRRRSACLDDRIATAGDVENPIPFRALLRPI